MTVRRVHFLFGEDFDGSDLVDGADWPAYRKAKESEGWRIVGSVEVSEDLRHVILYMPRRDRQ